MPILRYRQWKPGRALQFHLISGNISLIYYTDFADTITDIVEGEPIYQSNDLRNYRKKVEFYLKEHSNHLSVYKLRNNKRLSEADMKSLEKLLWEELGSRSEYEKEYGDTPVGRLVRKIVGLDIVADIRRNSEETAWFAGHRMDFRSS